MSLYDVAHLYRVRLKARFVLVQELFAVLGIAVGVALLFASQVATASFSGSVAQLTNGVVGQSRYQLEARSARGFPERVLGEVKALPGVRAAVPVLEAQIGLVGPRGRRAVYLLATEPRDVRFAGQLLRHFTPGQLAGERAIVLPSPLAGAIGAGQLQVIEAQVGAHLVPTLLAAVLTPAEIGPLIHSPVAIAPLRYAQSLTGMRGRLSRVFVQVRAGRDAAVLGGLRRIAAGRLNVEPANFDATQFDEAAIPVNQSVSVFSAICALVGFMFAFCAVLLTAHLRQRLIGELRLLGASPRQIVKVLLFDAAALGVAGSLLGLALGDVLSLVIFSASPEFLVIAFPIGLQRIVTWQSVALAVLAGLVAAAIGVLVPLRGARGRPRGPAAVDRSGLLRGAARAVGLACLAATTVIVLADPPASLIAIVTLLLAALLLLPPLVDAGVHVFHRLQRPLGSPAAALAAVELRSPAGRTRMLAITATAAIAVLGGAMLAGSRSNLQAGLTESFHRISSAADLWVSPATGDNLFATIPFQEIPLAPLRRLPGVRAVGAYRASFLNIGERRVWVEGSPATSPAPLTAIQLSEGDLALTNARLRGSGWVVLSTALAAEHHVGIGQRFTLPTPRPLTLRVAALITDLGWPAGAVIVSPADYVAGWGSAEPSAYSVMLDSGASPRRVAGEVRRTLAGMGYTGLAVQTERRHEQLELASGRQGLERLSEMALLLLLAGVLASASTMGAAVWQRRRGLARLKVQGLQRGLLWRSLLWEGTAVIGLGCLVGVAFGIMGQLLVSRALLNVTGFPMVISLALPSALASFALVALAASAIVAMAGYRATAVPAQA
ncbi:MAG TPA: FtsX-like permease family protein [Solirubrobacteraceae bacterium]|nr:FtsX-like permease family protein [Solirubrobacteraceae bacterium]